MRNLFLKKGFLLIVRIISIMAIILLSIGEYRNIIFFPVINENGKIVFSEFRIFLENVLSIILFFFLILNPQKLELIALGSFMYAINCTAFNTNIIMGFMMYVLGNAVLYVRGYYLKRTKTKITISITLYMLVFLISEILQNQENLINDIINVLGYLIVLGTIIVLIVGYSYVPDGEECIKKTLNLAAFTDLLETDVPLLKKVLENKQYKIIASEVFRAEGTIRNRLNKVYDILGVMDRMGFISTYMGCNIIFENLENKKTIKTEKKLLNNNKKK